MAIRQKQIFENGKSIVHFLSSFQSDAALCGQDLAGDTIDENGTYEAAQTTTEKVDCSYCKAIVNYCKSIHKSEMIGG